MLDHQVSIAGGVMMDHSFDDTLGPIQPAVA